MNVQVQVDKKKTKNEKLEGMLSGQCVHNCFVHSCCAWSDIMKYSVFPLLLKNNTKYSKHFGSFSVRKSL